LEAEGQDPENPRCNKCKSFLASRARIPTWNYSVRTSKLQPTHILTCVLKMVDS